MAADRELRGLLFNSRTIAALDAHYRRVLDRIVRRLAFGLSDPGAARARALIVEINQQIAQLDPRRDSFVRNWIRENVARAFVLGDRRAGIDLNAERSRSAAGERFGPANRTFTAINRTAMLAVTRAMEDILGRTAADMGSTIRNAIRSTQVTLQQSQQIRDATVGGIIRGATGRQVSDDIASALLGDKISRDVRARLSNQGFSAELFNDFERLARSQFIRVGARRMNVRAYANLVARTQMREAHKVGTLARLKQNGVNHVQISRHAQLLIDECTPFAGKVFFTGDGVDPLGFPRLSSIPNGGPPFHPNCRHVLVPYVVAFKSGSNIASAQESSAQIPRSLQGKTGSEVREQVAAMSDAQLKLIAPEGFEDAA